MKKALCDMNTEAGADTAAGADVASADTSGADIKDTNKGKSRVNYFRNRRVELRKTQEDVRV